MLSVPADMPVVIIPDDGNLPVCSACGVQMVKVVETYTDSIARMELFTIVRRVRNIYACVNCSEGARQTVHSDSIPENTVADPLLLADILNSKFNMGVPLYRQERLFSEQGLGITRQLMSSMIMRAGGRIMDNLEPLLEEELFRMPLINADETGLKVITLLDENGERKAPDSRFNSFIIGRIGVNEKGSPGLTGFIFRDNRRNLTIADLFDGYHGCVQTDGLSGYAFSEMKDGFTHLGCLVHCRRKAVEAMGNRKAGIAFEMVRRYAKIFHTESIWNSRRDIMSRDEFITGRKAAMLPLFEDMKDWLEKLVAKAKADGIINDRLNTAINYFLERYYELVRFLDYSYATSSNTIAELSIRKWVIDRNNMLFCFTETGADVSAFFFSLIVSCRNLGINPTDYLAHLFLNCNNLRNGDREGWGYSSLEDMIFPTWQNTVV
ncbi:MAG: IS66 family transposase [Bullifex sp.]|nr:IS66 family transposase [Bullifex sp.]